MNKNTIRRLVTVAVGGSLIAGALVGCSSNSQAAGVTTLNWWTRVSDVQKQQVKEFNATHKNIQVKLTQITDDQYVNKVGTGMRSSNAPDVLDFDDANAPLFSATGVLSDVSDRVKGLDFVDDLNPGMMKLGQYDKKTYSVPFNAGPSFLLYNKSLFAKAGLPDRAPTTWAEIKSDAAKIRALGGDTYGFDIPGSCGGCLSFTVQPMIWASGGTTMTTASPSQKTTYSTSPQVADTLEFYRDMWKSGVVNPSGQTQSGTTWGQDFEAGKVGIILAGAWMIDPAEKAGQEVGYAPIPGEAGSYSTFAGGDNLGLVATSKKQEQGWTFIKWLMSKEQQTKLVEAGQTPIRTDLVTSDFAEKYPVAAFQLKASEKSNAPESIATNALQLSATSPWLAAFQSVVYQGADVKTALKKADRDSQDLIEQAYKQVVK